MERKKRIRRHTDLEVFQRAFTAAMQEWAKLKEEWYAEKKAELQQKWQEASFRTRFKEIEYRLKMQRKRMRLLAAQVASA